MSYLTRASSRTCHHGARLRRDGLLSDSTSPEFAGLQVKSMSEDHTWLNRLLADPTAQGPDTPYTQRLRSIAAEGSAGEGTVVATVNGYHALVKIRIAREAFADLPRLGRRVKEAINRASDEAERLRPPPPLPPLPFGDPFDLIPEEPTPPPEPRPLPVVRSLELGYTGYLPAQEEPARSIFLDAAARVRMLIFRDSLCHSEELRDLFPMVAFKLGSRTLTAASVRRMLPDEGPQILRRFRRETGISLTEYIRTRQGQLAAKLVYRTDLPAGEVAELLGFDDEAALLSAVEESDLTAFCDNVESIRRWISRDAFRWPPELKHLFHFVASEIHRPGLTAASVRRFLQSFQQVDNPDILRQFRRKFGFSLIKYIRRRRTELAARTAYTSDMPLSKITKRYGFASKKALTALVERWSSSSIEELREAWWDRGMDVVVGLRTLNGEATQDDLKQHFYELERVYPKAMKRARENLAKEAAAAEEDDD